MGQCKKNKPKRWGLFNYEDFRKREHDATVLRFRDMYASKCRCTPPEPKSQSQSSRISTKLYRNWIIRTEICWLKANIKKDCWRMVAVHLKSERTTEMISNCNCQANSGLFWFFYAQWSCNNKCKFMAIWFHSYLSFLLKCVKYTEFNSL